MTVLATRPSEQGGMGGGGVFCGGADFSDILAMPFGDVLAAGGSLGSGHAAPISLQHGATLEEAVRGVTKEIRIPDAKECDVCHGSAAAQNRRPVRPVMAQARQMRCIFCGTADLSVPPADAYAD